MNVPMPDAMIAGYPVHAAAGLLPLMTGDPFDELVTSIREHGLREPVVLLDGELLDGRLRALACEQAGVPLRTREAKEDEAADPVRYVLDANVHRRHLTDAQRAAVAADLATLTRAEAGKRGGRPRKSAPEKPTSERGVGSLLHAEPVPGRPLPSVSSLNTSIADDGKRSMTVPEASTVDPSERWPRRPEGGISVREAAEMMQTTPRAVERAKALKAADEGLAEQVKSGELTSREAHAQLKARQSNLPGRALYLRVARKYFPMREAAEEADLARASGEPLQKFMERMAELHAPKATPRLRAQPPETTVDDDPIRSALATANEALARVEAHRIAEAAAPGSEVEGLLIEHERLWEAVSASWRKPVRH